MTDLFDMDGVGIPIENGFKNLNFRDRELEPVSNLNYKLLDSPDLDNFPKQKDESDTDNHDINDYFPSQSKPIHIDSQRSTFQTQSQFLEPGKRPRRKSSIVSSYEITIGKEDYISSSLIVDNTPRLSGLSEENLRTLEVYKPKLTDFEPIKVLGKGSYGKVLLVRDLRNGKLYAQKQLLKASMIVNREEDDDEEETSDSIDPNNPKFHNKNYQRTLNEKQILEIVNHPNIVKLFYAFQDNNKLYLILEYLQGGELFHHLSMEKFMSEKNAAYYLAQCSLALHYLHTRVKVIYRDLKPENCMLNSDGNLVLTDFGLSKVASEEEKLNSMTGTIQYMAPEVILGEEYDYLVDWWSLGCVAFDLLTGSPPFSGSNPDKVLQKIKNSKKTLKFPFYLSTDAKDILRKLLQIDPEKRFNVDEDWEKFKKHNFFRHVDWKHLENIETVQVQDSDNCTLPPILPIITDPILAENFDSEFTEMDFTPHQSSKYLNSTPRQGTFYMKDFSYINPKFIDIIHK
ncbi:uncharacterized protein KGF55_002690 [Candida pseudojiufengensis]|uniref:uncharacterized protein n=1 Tax=Candida pseudojiufengensis TaxID=497109 RepID=UPI0022242D11|nr:uncharacterized protein KGF55_002690 [Candida pseudojiufengensis]KAI5963810.1 hypothetical protein KGF55_002690 [Candida pseudojiufengensis]